MKIFSISGWDVERQAIKIRIIEGVRANNEAGFRGKILETIYAARGTNWGKLALKITNEGPGIKPRAFSFCPKATKII